MKTPFLALVGFLALPLSLAAADAPKLHPKLEPFRPYLGKTWRGEFKNSTPEKPMVDVARWERALNGQAVRVLHSVNDGAYGGESIIWWDKEKSQLTYHYFTTAGFHTSGTMSYAEGKFTSLEKVTGNTNGITEVKSVTEVRPDGTMLTKAEYLKGDQATGGREVIYREDPKGEVKFK